VRNAKEFQDRKIHYNLSTRIQTQFSSKRIDEHNERIKAMKLTRKEEKKTLQEGLEEARIAGGTKEVSKRSGPQRSFKQIRCTQNMESNDEEIACDICREGDTEDDDQIVLC